MDDRSRALKTRRRAKQRAEARAAFPLPDQSLLVLFDHVQHCLDVAPCDHTMQHTLGWLMAAGHRVEPVVDWLREHGGFCDCEVVANARDHWEQNQPGKDPLTPS
jgi:uncharacterized protein DUF2695